MPLVDVDFGVILIQSHHDREVVVQYMGPKRCARWTSETYTVLPASRALVERSARLRLIKDFKNIVFRTKVSVESNLFSEDGKFVTGPCCLLTPAINISRVNSSLCQAWLGNPSVHGPQGFYRLGHESAAF